MNPMPTQAHPEPLPDWLRRSEAFAEDLPADEAPAPLARDAAADSRQALVLTTAQLTLALVGAMGLFLAPAGF